MNMRYEPFHEFNMVRLMDGRLRVLQYHGSPAPIMLPYNLTMKEVNGLGTPNIPA